MGLFHNIVAGLGGNNETSYARDDNGQMQTTQTPSTPGQQWKHILAGALTGLAAGAQTHSPGAPVLSGLGAGFSAETQDLRNQDLLKRQQADRDFQDRQEATRNADTHTLQQAQLAHQNLENAKLTHDANLQSTFDANKMAESNAALQEHNLKMEKDAKDLGLINPRNITSYSQLSDQDNQDIAQNKKKFITGLNGGGTLYDRTKDPTTTPNESAYDVVKWGVDDKGKPVKKVLGHVNAGAGTMFQQEAAMQQETTTFADTHGKDVERRLKEAEINKNQAEAGKFTAEAANAGTAKKIAGDEKSYEFHRGAINKIEVPLQSQLDRIDRLQTSINERTPQADALLAPELLTAMAGGQGSGLRMNEAEISRIVGGRTNLEGLKAALNKWQLDPTKGLSVTDDQRKQMQSLVSSMAGKYHQKMQIINEAGNALAQPDTDTAAHRKIYNDMQQNLSNVDSVKVAPNKIGDTKTFPNGAKGVWDGHGWAAQQ